MKCLVLSKDWLWWFLMGFECWSFGCSSSSAIPSTTFALLIICSSQKLTCASWGLNLNGDPKPLREHWYRWGGYASDCPFSARSSQTLSMTLPFIPLHVFCIGMCVQVVLPLESSAERHQQARQPLRSSFGLYRSFAPQGSLDGKNHIDALNFAPSPKNALQSFPTFSNAHVASLS